MTYEIITCHTKAKKLYGLTFGRLTAIAPIGRSHRYIKWLCICRCMTETVVMTHHLISGTTKSCGCLAVETARDLLTKHGMIDHPIYATWRNMRHRCNNPNDAGYSRYGGRGISVCKEWDDFPTFLADMGTKPSKSHSIDRINNDGNYSPDNCRWATPTEQNRNNTNNRIITLNGTSLCVTEWAEITGVQRATIYARLNIGWSDFDALTRPVQKKITAVG